jgi:hypothetical protein
MLPYLLVETEMERWCSPLMSISPFGGHFQGMRVYRSDVVSLRIAEVKPSRSVHCLEESAGLFLIMVVFPQCRFRLARQNHPSATTTGAVNFPLVSTPIEKSPNLRSKIPHLQNIKVSFRVRRRERNPAPPLGGANWA